MQTVVYWIYQEGCFNCILQLKYMQITEYLTNTTCKGLYVLCLLSFPKTPLILVQTQQTLLCFIPVTICFQLNNTPIRVTQCNSQFRSLGVKVLCEFHFHDNIAFTFKWYGYTWNKSGLFPKDLNWVQHWVRRIGLFWRRVNDFRWSQLRGGYSPFKKSSEWEL